MVALGLLLLAGAGIVAAVGFFANTGADHTVGAWSAFGYHLHGSTGRLFLVGVIVGAIAMLGLNILLAGLGRGMKNRVRTRRELKQTRRRGETAEQERDRLARELEEERARNQGDVDLREPTATGAVADEPVDQSDHGGRHWLRSR